MGPRVSSLLRQVLEQDNARLLEPARQCLAALERRRGQPMPEAAAASARPAPASAVRSQTILAYVPFAENDTLASQLVDLLASIGCAEGKADPALIRALDDKLGAPQPPPPPPCARARPMTNCPPCASCCATRI